MTLATSQALRAARTLCLLLLASLCQQVQADEQVAEQLWQQARSTLASGQYTQALQQLRSLQREHADFSKLPAVQVRVAVLHEARNGDAVVPAILAALDAREAGRIDQAVAELGRLANDYQSHPLGDDALYLQAYVQLMDHYDFATALDTLARLRDRYPESAYTDTADYLTAIALEQTGQPDAAVQALSELRDRHTAWSLPFGMHWPSGDFLSRYWFDRASQRLELLALQRRNGARVLSRTHRGGRLVARIEAAGESFDVALRPAALSAHLSPAGPQLYTGELVGEPDSWVRVTIDGARVQGMLSSGGQTRVLRPGTLTGTLDYYHPKLGDRSEPAWQVDGPLATARALPAGQTQVADVRVVPVSMVIDSQFDRYHNGVGLTRALSQLNVADGLYRQFGLSFTADQVIDIGPDEPDPFATGPKTLEAMLRDFRRYRLRERSRFADSALIFLFTGNEKTDVTLGLAWINTLCRTDGYDVGVTTPSSVGGLLLAHELGHSLGAQHDSDTRCNQPTHQLMWPHLSERTVPEFTACAGQAIVQARNRQCLLDAVDLQLDARASAQGVGLEIHNADTTLAAAARLLIDVSEPVDWVLPSGCYWADPGAMRCELGPVMAGATRELALLRTGEQASGPAPIRVELEVVGLRDSATGNNRLDLAFDEWQVTSASPPAAPAGGAFDLLWLSPWLALHLAARVSRARPA